MIHQVGKTAWMMILAVRNSQFCPLNLVHAGGLKMQDPAEIIMGCSMFQYVSIVEYWIWNPVRFHHGDVTGTPGQLEIHSARPGLLCLQS